MEPLKIYLCAQYARIYEVQDYRDDLVGHGWECTSYWLNGDHTPDQDFENTHSPILQAEYWPTYGEQDMMDVKRSDILIACTEPPDQGPARGGRHWEAGYATGLGKLVIVMGPKENVFYHLPETYGITQVDSWAEAVALVARIDANRQSTGRLEFPASQSR